MFLLEKTGDRNEPVTGGDGARKHTEPRMYICQAIDFKLRVDFCLVSEMSAGQPPFPSFPSFPSLHKRVDVTFLHLAVPGAWSDSWRPTVWTLASDAIGGDHGGLWWVARLIPWAMRMAPGIKHCSCQEVFCLRVESVQNSCCFHWWHFIERPCSLGAHVLLCNQGRLLSEFRTSLYTLANAQQFTLWEPLESCL